MEYNFPLKCGLCSDFLQRVHDGKGGNVSLHGKEVDKHDFIQMIKVNINRGKSCL